MTDTYKPLGQAAPGAGALTDLYTAPGAGSGTVVSSLVVCNRGAAAAKFRVAVSVGGGAVQDKDYIYYDLTLPPNDTFIATFGGTLGGGDKVRVYVDVATVSFNLFGAEVS